MFLLNTANIMDIVILVKIETLLKDYRKAMITGFLFHNKTGLGN